MLSFSTCWNSHRHTEGEAVVDEILEMGFTTIEVSHGLKISLLPGIQQRFEQDRVAVSSLHNFCPSPVELMIDAPDAYEFTSHRSYDRDRALSLTMRTLEMAARFRAKRVVLHMGSVPIPAFTGELEDLASDGELNSRRFVKAKLAMIRKRESIAPLYLRRAREALEQIAEKAKELDLIVGVESRSHFEQVPSEREMVELMEAFADNPHVGYWHDFGHVQRKANIELLDHREWLERMRPHLVGCHLHDVVWPSRDHRVPFEGSIDYDVLVPLLPPDAPIIWELSPRRKKADIVAALDRWSQRFPETLR